MRSLFALAAVLGLVSAGNLYTYRGTSHFRLGEAVNEEYEPQYDAEGVELVEPIGNYTNSTIFTETVIVEEKPVITIKVDHGVDVGYSGQYKSAPLEGFDSIWDFNYDLKAYAKVNEKITLDIAGFYQLTTEFTLDLFRLRLLKQHFKFVHPLAILDGKNSNPVVELDFDLKLESIFAIQEFMNLEIVMEDKMKANFNKQLDDIVKELFSFAITAVQGDEYIAPDDDTKNIANGANYYPNAKDFKYGGQVLTNKVGEIRIPKTQWSIPMGEEFIRMIVNNPNWQFADQYLVSRWIFGTRDNNFDVAL